MKRSHHGFAIALVALLSAGFAPRAVAQNEEGSGERVREQGERSDQQLRDRDREREGRPDRQRPGAAGDSDHRMAPPWGRRGGWAGDRPDFELTAELRQRVIAVVHDLRPLGEEEVSRLRDMPPDEFLRLFREKAGRIWYLTHIREVQPALYELKIAEYKVGAEVARLTRAYYAAVDAGDSDEAQSTLAALRDRANAQYSLRLQTRALEIEAFEQRVARMRDSLLEERDQQDANINLWLEQLEAGEFRRMRPGSDNNHDRGREQRGDNRDPASRTDGPPRRDRRQTGDRDDRESD